MKENAPLPLADFRVTSWGQRKVPEPMTPIRRQGESWVACEIGDAEAVHLGGNLARPLPHSAATDIGRQQERARVTRILRAAMEDVQSGADRPVTG